MFQDGRRWKGGRGGNIKPHKIGTVSLKRSHNMGCTLLNTNSRQAGRFVSIFSIIYAEVMNCIRIFADFVFKVVSQLTRVIQPQNKRSIFQRDYISYILYHICTLYLNCRNSSMIQTTYHFRRKPGAYFKN